MADYLWAASPSCLIALASGYSLNCTLDDIVLRFATDIDKVRTVTSDPDNQLLIFFWFSLGSPQVLIRYTVELDMIQSEIIPGFHVRLPELVAIFSGKLGGRQSLVQQEGPALGDMVYLGTGFQYRGGTLLIESRPGRNTTVIEGVSPAATVGQCPHDIGIVDITADVLRQNRPVVSHGILQFF